MQKTAPQLTFFVHDYETFGKHPAYDRPAQFAGVRTDNEFNPIEPPVNLYCRPPNDYLPDPHAVLITGITPQYALQHGVSEHEFAQQIETTFSHPYSCILGYNNIRFDDEFTRYLLYRNLRDPYAYSWQQHNSRWDLLDVVRTCYALRPTGVVWPYNEQGLPSFKLEDLSRANQLEHQQAHEALSDVYATIAIAKLLKQAQPRLFNYLLQLRHKKALYKLINIADMTPLLHVSGMFGSQRHNISIVAPLAWHPENKNALIVCDLQQDIRPLLTLNAQQIRERLYTPHAELAEDEAPIPLKLVHINKCPVLAPLQTLRDEDVKRLHIDRQHCLEQAVTLYHSATVREKVVAMFSEQTPYPTSDDVDAQLYDGFFSPADQAVMQIILQTDPLQLPYLTLHMEDPRLAKLLFRYRARNFPHTLQKEEQRRWQRHCQSKFTETYLQQYLYTLEQLTHQYQQHPTKIALLNDLFHYVRQLVDS